MTNAEMNNDAEMIDGTTDLSDTHVHAEMKINGINEDVKKY